VRIVRPRSVNFYIDISKAQAYMPTAMRLGKYRFFFFSNEGTERRHIHVESDDYHAKFWLDPIDLAKSVGYKERELREIQELIQENIQIFKAKWDAHFNF